MTVAVATLAGSGVLLAGSPAQARPKDCSLSVKISPDKGAMYARADVKCKKKEHFAIKIIIRRKDFGTNAPVATSYKGYHKSGYTFRSTTEPCKDVSTKKKYFAHAYLYDTRFGYPIEVKDIKSNTIKGHC